jgi:pimeloyl-ACP methyl ester carboxylesterase
MQSIVAWLRRQGYVRGSLIVGGGTAALAWLAVAVISIRHGWQLCHFDRVRVPAERAAQAKRLLPDLRELEVRTSDGLRLKSWFVPPKNGVVIVLVTGLGGNRSSMLDEAVVLSRHGYGCLSLEARAHGDSEGNVATWGQLEAGDVVEAVKTAYAQPGVTKVGALGFSVGGSTVALAAARDPSIRAVVLYATWTSLREEIAYKSQGRGPGAAFWVTKGFELSGVDVDKVHPEPEMKRIAPRPLLLLSGGVDGDTPPEIMDRIFAASGEPRELWRLPTVGHGGYLQSDPQEWERRVVGFLDKALVQAK